MNDPEFHGDRPIQVDNEDRFGFTALAERIADALTTQAGTKGFVFGLEGKWGSGKSSLLALSLKKLRAMDPQRVAAIEFRPWLIGDRDQLLTSLFEEFAKAIAALEHARGDATKTTMLAARSVSNQVKSFARHLGPMGKLASLAGVFVPGASAVGDIMEKIAAVAAEQEGGPTLVEQKEKLSAALLKFDCRIVVTIDDVDRLEPKEIAELLRLVRSVADFPNVSYLLCYDGRILAHAIKTGTGVPDGTAYLEKIVQTEVAVPSPESFALRRWFSNELESFAECQDARVSYLQQVISETGGRVLVTPRAVVRVLDSLRVYWPRLEGQVDLTDLVWLRMIAVGYPNLFRWIEAYLVEFVAASSGRAIVSSAEQTRMGKDLDLALAADRLDWEGVQFELERHLPGIQTQKFNERKDERLFHQVGSGRYGGRANDGRLQNPSYTRLFFTLIVPADAITGNDIIDLIAAAQRGASAVATLVLSMNKQKGDAGGSKAERLFDELKHGGLQGIGEGSLESLVIGFSDAADELAAEGDTDWGHPRVWYLLRAILNQMRNAVPPERFQPLYASLFRESGSIGFLTYLLRDETFAQGYFGGRPDPSNCLATAETFAAIRVCMLERYDRFGFDAVLDHPNALQMLYAWAQAGGGPDLIGRIAARAASDTWLTDFVSKLHGPNSSLSLSALSTFFETPTAVIRRLDKLAEGEPPNVVAAAAIESLKSNIRFDGGRFEDVIADWERRAAEGAAGEEGD